MTENILRQSAQGFNCTANAYWPQLRPTNSILFRDNLFDDISGIAAQILSDNQSITFDHNTFRNVGNVLQTGDAGPVTGMTYKNNIATHGQYGIVGSGYSTGDGTIYHYFPGGVFTHNVLIGGYAPYYAGHLGNFFPALESGVGFVDPSAHDYRLLPSSPYRAAGTDGQDIGANLGAVMTATDGVTEGLPPPSDVVPPGKPDGLK